MKSKTEVISLQTLKRLPIYLDYLEREHKNNNEYISTPKIASFMGLSEILVKKDISVVTSKSGIPKKGHRVSDLIEDIKTFLGYNDVTKAVLVGAGRLGSALLGYNGFKNRNLEIVVAFDNDPSIIGTEINSIKILDLEKLEDLCKRMQIHIGIITTSTSSAQMICDRLVSSGIEAIWNFAPVSLKVPSNVIVQNENMASSFAVLSKKLIDKKHKEEEK